MMTSSLRGDPAPGAFTESGSSVLAAMNAPRTFDEPTLDQLFSEPIVQQLTRRDRTDEASIRQLLQEAAAVRLASRETTIPTPEGDNPPLAPTAGRCSTSAVRDYECDRRYDDGFYRP
jgi:hypothetical protein